MLWLMSVMFLLRSRLCLGRKLGQGLIDAKTKPSISSAIHLTTAEVFVETACRLNCKSLQNIEPLASLRPN